MTADLDFDPLKPAAPAKLPEVATKAQEQPGDREPTTYHQMTETLEQRLEADSLADGHSALMLERAKGTVPVYPQQPGNVWNNIDRDPATTGERIDEVKDVSRVGG
jgi:hypothetical protein